MQSRDWSAVAPDEGLDFWFPDAGHDRDFDAHRAFWTWRMRGEADETIRALSGADRGGREGLARPLAGDAARALALVIALDQFPRSVWGGTPGAFAQAIKACRLVLDGFGNGHYDALPNVWEKTFCLIANGHCEGPDHLERLERGLALAGALVEEAPRICG